jgi:hypothetical protein
VCVLDTTWVLGPVWGLDPAPDDPAPDNPVPFVDPLVVLGAGLVRTGGDGVDPASELACREAVLALVPERPTAAACGAFAGAVFLET